MVSEVAIFRSRMASLQPPEPFDVINPSDWPDWIEEFEDYSYASGLQEKDGEIQVRKLLYTMGRKAREILRSLNVMQQELESFHAVTQKFQANFVHTKNVA